MRLTLESRQPLARARFFLDKAKACRSEERVAFEAFLEASIVFGRAAVHRFKTAHIGHPHWKAVWDSWAPLGAVQFFRAGIFSSHLPLIIVQREDYREINDGSHRAVAMHLSGIETGNAYIGVERLA